MTKIAIYKRRLNGRQFDLHTKDEFFKEEFVLKVKWDKLEFSRPTVDTKARIRRATRNNGSFKFTIVMDDDFCGRYDISKEEDKLTIQLL